MSLLCFEDHLLLLTVSDYYISRLCEETSYFARCAPEVMIFTTIVSCVGVIVMVFPDQCCLTFQSILNFTDYHKLQLLCFSRIAIFGKVSYFQFSVAKSRLPTLEAIALHCKATLLNSHFGMRVFSCKFAAYFQNTFF